ncbi:Sm-like ribonucleo protein [Calocera cornea HHB12733]|uniref:Sm protein B n=1 Tax=Calocera cornea HHB12733 TaxID=1353952 RepID=A0A165FIQ7_9BASI|nr:Sm-like ribonucleo protein [Calocera cornea HHB12733]
MAPPKAKGGKMLALINYRLRVTLNDGRELTGQMLAFDRHMNLVLADCEEFRKTRSKVKAEGADGVAAAVATQEIKRTLGLVILRGETVVSISVEGPPPATEEDKKNQLLPGPGRGMPAGRGMGMMGFPPPPFAAGRGMPFPPGPPGAAGGPPGFPPGFPPGGPPGFPGAPPGFPPGMPFRPPGFPGA